MKHFYKKALTTFMALATVMAPLSSMTTPVYAAEETPDDPEAGQEAVKGEVPDSIVLKIYKRYYDEEKPTYRNELGELTEEELQDSKAWDKETMGDVGFTIKAITPEDLQSVGIAYEKGSVGYDMISDAQIEEIKAHASELLALEGAEEQMVDAQGDISLDLSGLAPADASNVVAILVSETTSPDLYVAQKADDIVIPYPVVADSGEDFLREMSIYPKNQSKDVVISLEKTGQKVAEETGQKSSNPLANAKFKLYRGLPGEGTPYLRTVQPEGEGEATEEELIVTTDEAGHAEIKGLPLGSYYLVEEVSEVADLTGETDSDKQYIDKYTQNNAENVLTFTVAANADESVLEASAANYLPPRSPEKENNVDYETIGAPNQRVEFTVTQNIPENLEDYTVYDIVDSSTPNLTVDQESIKVDVAGNVLVIDEDYTVSYDTEGETHDLRVAIKPESLKALDLEDNSVLTLTYESLLDATAMPDDAIENEVVIEYNNGNGVETDKVQTPPEDSSYKVLGKKFKKQDDSAEAIALAGARFVLRKDGKYVRTVKDSAAEDGAYGLTFLDGELTAQEAYAQLQELTVDTGDVALYESEEDGIFSVTGLPEGDYELVEVKAPKGYQLRTAPIEFSLSAASQAEDWAEVASVENSAIPELPFTGSNNLILNVGLGVSLVLISGVLYVVLRKKEEE